MDKLRNYTYKNARIYKERTKIWHNKHITRREFIVGQQILSYNSHLRIFLGKSRSTWSGLFVVKQVFSYGAVKIINNEKKLYQRSKIKAILSRPAS